MQSIALLGLGTMGTAMAKRWLAAGHKLRLYNRTAAKAKALEAAGAVVAATPREAATGADVVVSMVADDDAAHAVWFGADGAIAGLSPGALAIEQGTLSPAFIRELGRAVEMVGARFIDAPVGGGPSIAAAGKLVIFAGGAAEDVEAARPIFEAVASRIEHVGEAGAGATWKLINYMIAGAQIASLAEGLALAKRAGISLERAGDLITKGAAASPAVVSKVPRMVERRFDNPDAALRLVAKDQRYTLDLARTLGADVSLLPVVSAMFDRAEEAGLGDLDLAAVFEAVSHPPEDA